jgi:dTMP kinase
LKNRLLGKFIVLDGPDGCGKSTQVKLLAQWISSRGIEVETFRDPGTTAIGEKIRQILLDPVHNTMDTRTELLLYMAARAQLWAEEIAPAINKNKCVILDRWLSSTCAYQGCAGGFGMDKVINIGQDCLERPWPDLTIILDVDLETGSKRLNAELDRMEQKPKSYHQKVRRGFVELAKDRDSFAVVDAADDIETVHKKIIEIIERKIIL